jgi:hypothetical protein
MANTFAPFGFQQLKGTGSAPTYEQVVGIIAYNYSTKIFFNDPVALSSGNIIQAVAGEAPPVAGIFVGCKYLSTSQKRTVWSNFWPGADTAYPGEAYYVNDPNAQFLVQSSSAAITQANVGSMIDFAVGTGNTASGLSGAYVNQATIVAPDSSGSAELPFRIVSIATNVPAVATGAGATPYDPTAGYNYVVVAFNAVQTKYLGTV